MSNISDSLTSINQFNGQLPGGDCPPPNGLFAAGPPADDPLVLVIQVGGESFTILPTVLQDQAALDALRQRCTSAAPLISVDRFLSWNEADLVLVIAFIGSLPAYRIETSDGEFTSIFDAIVASLMDDRDVARCERGIRAAIQAAAIVHATGVTTACSAIRRRLDELKVRGWDFRQLVKAAEQLLPPEQQRGGMSVEPRYVLEILEDAPVPGDALIPDGWDLNLAGIAPINADDGAVMPTPIVITRRYTGVGTATESLQLAWMRNGQWIERIVARATVAAARSIVELAAYGLPVTSNNAKDVVQYLADFEAANIAVFPHDRTTRQLGWQGTGGSEGFLCGRRLLTGEVADAQRTRAMGEPEPGGGNIIFRGADDGDEQLVAGYHAAGTFQAWREAIRPLAVYPRAKFAIYAALAAPLLQILETGNFIVSYAGITSSGKTTTLRAAASCWGRADERAPDAALGTCDSTRVWIARASAVRNHLPMILDDTKRARRPEDIAQTIYDFTSGRDRGRGTPGGGGAAGGVSHSATWTAVMLVSGEQQITSFSHDGGTRARVLELWGSPFGQTNADTKAVVDRVNDGIRRAYGHAGPLLVEYLINHRQQWPVWRTRFEEIRQNYVQRADGEPVASRLADHLAAVTVAAELVHEAGCLPWEYQDGVAELWPDLVAEAPEADRATMALRYVYSWACAHMDEFFDRRPPGNGQPQRGWAGRWDKNKPPATKEFQWAYIGFIKERLDEILAEAKYEPTAVLRTWRDRNWLRLDSEGKARVKARIGDVSVSLVGIERNAIEEVEGPLEEGRTAEALVPRIATLPLQDVDVVAEFAVPGGEQEGNGLGNTLTA